MIDDHEMPIVFSNLKVDVPILSVRRMVKLGNDVIFTEIGGSITNKMSGQKLTFIEADGTYWIKLKIQPPDDVDMVNPSAQSFTRP